MVFSGCSPEGKNKNSRDFPTSTVFKKDGKEMVLVPAGEFWMGTDKVDTEDTHLKIGTVKPLYLDQKPKQKIHLDAFYIDKYEVTNREYKKFIDETLYHDRPSNWQGDNYPPELADRPVTNVSWGEAMAYALWAGKTLPTEQQWEKAARGEDGRLYPWGNDYKKGVSNIGLEGRKDSAKVGSYPKDISPYGAMDMGGNVMEWTLSWYLPYSGSDYRNKKMGQRLKVLRGNGFQKGGHYFLDAYRFVFHRTEADPDEFYENVGFRCVKDIKRLMDGDE
ncbi:MAG: formylglycine-generating enzyme family protein [Candidatus Nitronauta litoralis]|uniref:Formylglycine-generating enzyme family protein n=1 Tax=Candidatus Nitronauta litoralis TaxID=2705533 RepID=A0A7T0G1W0_9BACT|nr:MAG: formylglycine-generating enzyme family protein [Candidatus Nitronauta litoralis]